MKIRLVEEMFRSETYDLDITDEGFVFSEAEEKEILIPFVDIRHFILDGQGKKTKRFVLETVSSTYEGSFIMKGDADEVIQRLREKCGCCIDVRFDMN